MMSRMDIATAQADARHATSTSGRQALAALPGRSALRRLVALLSVDRRLVWIMAVLQFLQAATYIPLHASVQWLIDHCINRPETDLKTKTLLAGAWALAVLAVWPIHAWFTVKAFACSQSLIRTTTARLRRLVVDQLQRMSLSFITRRGSGALSNQVTVDLGRVEGFLGNVAGNFMVGMSVSVAAAVWLLWMNWKLALIALLAIPLQMVLIRLTARRIQALNRKVQVSSEHFASRIVEFIGGLRLTKSLGNEDIASERMAVAIEDMRVAGLRQSVFTRWLWMGVQFLGEYTGTMAWTAAAIMCAMGQATLGEVVGFMATFGFVRAGFQTWMGAYDAWQQARPGMDSLLELLDSRELEDYHHVERHTEIRGRIEFADVSFRYPGADGVLVLDNLRVIIPAGQRVGLVGETGAGKSTFLDLVLGFYRPTSGTIAYDGLPVEQIGLRQLRRSCAIMGQDAFLWNTTIRENIRYGRPQASDAEVEEAARLAQAHDFILATEKGYDTACGERGGKLSGGQRQRLALARLFLRQPRIVILDEPTSALDLETEARLQDDLDRFCKGRTTFIVAHRLSTLRGVDRVLVFSKGRIVEDGPPAELLRRPDGHYARLHALSGAKPGHDTQITL